jgi:hypothetical protein
MGARGEGTEKVMERRIAMEEEERKRGRKEETLAMIGIETDGLEGVTGCDMQKGSARHRCRNQQHQQ